MHSCFLETDGEAKFVACMHQAGPSVAEGHSQCVWTVQHHRQRVPGLGCESDQGELYIQIKLLQKPSPILFTWWNRETNSAEGCLVACPGCQELDLTQEPRSSKRGKAKRAVPEAAACGSWSVGLGEALSRAEIVTIPVEAEGGSILLDENTKIFPVEKTLEHTVVNQLQESAIDGKHQRSKASKKPRGVVGKIEEASTGDSIGICEEEPCQEESNVLGCGGSGNSIISKEKHVRDSIQNATNRGPPEDDTYREDNSKECQDPPSGGTHMGILHEGQGSDAGMQDGGVIRIGKDADIRDHFAVEMDGGTCPQVREKLGFTYRGGGKEDAGHPACESKECEGGDGQSVTGNGAVLSQEGLSDGEMDLSIVQDMVKTGQGGGIIDDEEEASGCEDAVGHPGYSTGSDIMRNRTDVLDTTNTSEDTSQLVVQQGPSGLSVSGDVLGEQMVGVDSIPSDAVVVLQDGQELAASEVDKALLEVLKGLMHPQNQARPKETPEVELDRNYGLGSHVGAEDVEASTSLVDPVYAIHTPAMVKYREHQRELYLKKLHKTSEGTGGNQVTLCEVCGAILSMMQIRKHMKYMHSSTEREKNHQCSTCGKRFSKADSLVRHQRTHFEPTFHCSRCDRSFRHNFQLQSHERQHAGHDPPRRIHKPRYKTANPKPRKLVSDSDSASEQDAVECTVCQTRIGAKSLVRHMKMRHPGMPCGFFGCEVCDEKFTTSSRLHCHTLTHKGLEFHCGFCRVVLPGDLERVRHERSHVGVDVTDQTGVKFKCGFCQKNYSRVRDRLRHEMAHFDSTIDLSHGTRDRSCHVNKSVQCPLCNKTLKQNSMRSHMDSHTGKTWTCDVCGKTISKGARYDHLKLHSGVKEHACGICRATFHTKHALLAHARKHTQEKPVPCRFCGRKFARYEGRNNHEREHTGERPYQCGKCQKAWKDRPTYAQHMKKHHPGEPLMTRKRPGAALLPQLPGVPAT